MTVTPLQDFVSSVISRQSPLAAKSTAAVSTTPAVNNSSSSQSATQLATSSQSVATANLRNASISFAQLSSLLQVTQGGTSQSESILQGIQQLAQQAATDVPATTLQQLDDQYQQLLGQLDQVASSTQYDGSSLLNGSLSSQSATGSADSSLSGLSLPDLSAQGLFGTGSNLLSNSAANNVLSAVSQAQDTISTTNNSINGAQAQVSLASASIETALTNNTAANSTLTDSDLEEGGDSDLSTLLDNAGFSSQVQTGNLSPALLNLLQG